MPPLRKVYQVSVLTLSLVCCLALASNNRKPLETYFHWAKFTKCHYYILDFITGVQSLIPVSNNTARENTLKQRWKAYEWKGTCSVFNIKGAMTAASNINKGEHELQ